MRVLVTAEAEADLESIGDYIARDNPVRALSFVRELYQLWYPSQGARPIPELLPHRQ